MSRRVAFAAAGLAAALAAGCGTGQSPANSSAGKDYPAQPVTVVVPFSAGGPTDAAGRAVAPCLGDQLGQSFVVENRPGAAGSLGVSELTRTSPDGYTLGIVSVSTGVVAPIFQDDVAYTHEELTPVGMITEIPSVIAVAPDSKYQSAKQLIAAAKKNPNEVSVAIPGTTTLYGIELQRMEELYGINFQPVPFDGGSPALAALLGGNVDALWDAGSQRLVDAIEEGKIRPLATGAAERPDYLDQVPTLKELGYEKLVYSTTFFTLSGPQGLDDDVVRKLESGLRKCLKKPEVIKPLGEVFVPDEFVGSSEVAQRFDDLAQTYRKFAEK